MVCLRNISVGTLHRGDIDDTTTTTTIIIIIRDMIQCVLNYISTYARKRGKIRQQTAVRPSTKMRLNES
jgi:hypothetical protein